MNLATIVLMPFHWAANLNSVFALSRSLQERGHRLYYLCVEDSEDRIRSQGFEFVPIFSRVLPKGTMPEQYANEARGKYLGAAGFKARVQGMCDLLREGELDKRVSEIGPDLFLIASATPWVGIAAKRTGVPVINFSSSLISVWDPAVPPFETGLIPDQKILSRVKTALAWRAFFLLRALTDLGPGISNDLKELARACDYPLNKIDFKVETWPRLSLPELVFCPKEFDFPRSRTPDGAYFVEPSIDMQRRDVDFPWGRLPDGKPIIYCSLGSVATFKYVRRAARFFRIFMEAMARRPHLQGVVPIGSYIKADDFNCPENVVLVPEAPQLELLKRASLMVSHGGFSGVKESIFMGVPMVVVPMFYDQPGNAARVVYHKLGVRGRMKDMSAIELGRLMDAVLEDHSYSARMKLMSRRFVELQRQAPSIDVVERALAGKIP
jgi:zeaxanthin glucosyltransferase